MTERIRSVDTQTTSPKNLFMAGSDTIIFGEIAFQLERVVLSRVFRGGSKQLTGYTLSNIEKMIRSHYDYHERPMLQRQLDGVKGELQICGWNHEFHPNLVAHLIKKFGTFPTNVRAKSAARKRGWLEPQALKEEVLWRIPQKYIHDMIIILDCLFYLSKKYDIPLFTW
ncbi:speriolin-like protein [Lytechinus pictus]|uniref:speriolin-like protein n=1 Tax=Lytechinus pictus TaxID=7653 RepID=UPI0030B9D68B